MNTGKLAGVIAAAFAMPSIAFSEEVEGEKAKSIVTSGEVISAANLYEPYLGMMGAEAAMVFFVKKDKKIYNCVRSFPGGWFCEAL